MGLEDGTERSDRQVNVQIVESKCADAVLDWTAQGRPRDDDERMKGRRVGGIGGRE